MSLSSSSSSSSSLSFVIIGIAGICMHFGMCGCGGKWKVVVENVQIWWEQPSDFVFIVAAGWINIYLSLNLFSVYNFHWMEKAKYYVVWALFVASNWDTYAACT